LIAQLEQIALGIDPLAAPTLVGELARIEAIAIRRMTAVAPTDLDAERGPSAHLSNLQLQPMEPPIDFGSDARMNCQRDGEAMKMLKPEEVCAQLAISRPHFYELVRQGVIPVVRLGKYYRVHPEALDSLLGLEGSTAYTIGAGRAGITGGKRAETTTVKTLTQRGRPRQRRDRQPPLGDGEMEFQPQRARLHTPKRQEGD
jgi:excisionase family DNA binding protein